VARQFQSEKLGKNLKTASNVLKPVVGLVLSLGNYFFIGCLSTILSDITHLGNFTNLLMINVTRASMTNVFLQLFLDIGKFDFLPTDKLLDEYVFGNLEETPAAFQAVGYETYKLFQQMGSSFYLYLGFAVFIIGLLVAKRCKCKNEATAGKI